MRQATHVDLEGAHANPDTGLPLSKLKALGRASVATPAGFKVHERLVRGHVAPRLKEMDAGDEGGKIDWATAEALAFAAALDAGHDVRMTGQDVQRGTFSHRHAVLIDQDTATPYTPLNHIAAGQRAQLHSFSSLLSEEAVLGFEYGYSWESPSPLVLWEAQFGDFANGAQIMLDAFITSGETKWMRQSGLVMLLPHGYDGAGPVSGRACRDGGEGGGGGGGGEGPSSS
jgi:2-oxoglutarate dehydrogenase complex dehydrogenase (E1) component-like enzyme